MKLSTNTGYLTKIFDIEKCIDICADAGFDCLDFSFFREEFYADGGVNDSFFTEARRHAEARGITFNQAHAPFPSSLPEEGFDEKRFSEIVRSMKNASLLGVKNIVVHPCQHLTYDDDGVPEILFEMNMKFYKKLVPYCDEYGISVAIENMWQAPRAISHSTCSRPAEFVRYMDGLDNKHFVACLDIGHAELVREKPDDLIRALGSKYLKSLHVHDVDGTRDSHTLPYFGIVNWDKVMKALAEIGYDGELTYEAGNFLVGKPAALLPACVRFMAETGRYLAAKFDEYKK